MESESESSEEERVVRSAKDRAFDSFQTHVKAIRNGMKIRDFSRMQTEFDALVKVVAKSKTIIQRHGGVPRFFIRLLCDLEDFVKSSLADKVGFKKLSPAQGRALNRMKLTLRKHNKSYEAAMTEYRMNPVVSESASESESSSSSSESESDSDNDSDNDSSSSSSSDSSAPAVKKKVAASSSSSSSSSDSGSDSGSDSSSGSDNDEDSDEEWGSSSSSSSSSESEADEFAQLKGRARWLKKTTAVVEKVTKDKAGRAEARKAARDAAAAAEKAAAAAGAGPSKSLIPEKALTAATLDRKVKEVVSSRGRKGTDNRSILRQLEGLSRLAVRFGPRFEVPVLMHVVTAQFDLLRTMDDFMDAKTWKSCAGYLWRIASALEDGEEKYTLGHLSADEAADDLLATQAAVGGKMKAAAAGGGGEGAMAAVAADEKLINPETGESETEDERAERIRLEKEGKMTPEELRTIIVIGSLSLHLTRLDEEYIKSLQRISPHTSEYVTRLRDEARLVELLGKAQAYYTRIGSKPEAAELAQLRVEHLYYRHDTIADQVDRAALFHETYGEAELLHPACISADADEGKSNDYSKSHPAAALGRPSVATESEAPVDSAQLITDLCTYVYKYGSDRSKTRSMLCHIFHHALHDRFLEARDLLLMSHLQDTISNAGDVSTMLLFNRMMVTMGLAAFRLGRIWDAHQCLGDVCSGRVRELLAQGVSSGRFSDKTDEQEKAERRRQTPYHMHINMDLLEACHLTSAMLLEVPNMAQAGAAGGDDTGGPRRARVISRQFRKHHDIYDRSVFTGPPEQTRDYVMVASRALMRGDWKKMLRTTRRP